MLQGRLRFLQLGLAVGQLGHEGLRAAGAGRDRFGQALDLTLQPGDLVGLFAPGFLGDVRRLPPAL